jgi:hypothetical protein
MDLHPVKVVIDAIDNPTAIRFQVFFENHAPWNSPKGARPGSDVVRDRTPHAAGGKAV